MKTNSLRACLNFAFEPTASKYYSARGRRREHSLSYVTDAQRSTEQYLPLVGQSVKFKQALKSIFCLLLLACSCSVLNGQHIKKRVAVLNFENKTNNRYSAYTSQKVEDEVTDMIITELVKSEKFKVIERNQLDALLKEQDLGKSGIITAQSAAQMGQVLGVELAVFGAVTEFGNKKNEKGFNMGGVNVGLGKNAAVIAIDIRIVNTSTGEILAAENIRKTKSGISAGLKTKDLDFGSKTQFDNSVVGKATRAAIDQVVALLIQSAANIPWSAKVITTNSSKVYINSGQLDGIKVGTKLKVYRPGEALIDPDTGINLGSVDQQVGTLVVVDNLVGEGKASVCSIDTGNTFDKGDIVKLR